MAALADPDGITMLINVWTIKDGVDDATVLQHNDDARRQAHHDGCRKDVPHALKKQLGDVAGTLSDGETTAHSHEKEQRGNLHDVPTITQHAHDEVIHSAEQQGQDEVGRRFPQGEESDQGKQPGANGQQG